ncbi:uroporphyrinogen-III C-methyltransferase [Massilia antarctica]|uniref:uroporphyrinogen-III C-methyltransferase n=1 Tax=Massilia antarctica TaxID=2765360 RepID=UPI0006BB6CB4|nr:uroporphyrinogen-III C-methyltransferase [Massilia sp. H27-R4]MCY0912818.1 uroporphyrinogen-III C-methyltransferase [Massilia sp. H27-R4]CUI03955.1 Uroporphyrinogen-III synthase / Homolog of E. coli HemX protein [Janthinobacterium sp. CG23_2]CUU27741.1 Uroporphyrinogen-III synthase / Homolog of E. coli HemX protein [Janthinobacterium sp. CG23_2]
MNELPTLPEHSAAPGAAPHADQYSSPPSARARASGGARITDILQRPMTVVVILLALLLAAHAWSTRSNLLKLRMDMANRLQKGEVLNTETSTLVRTVQDQTRDLQAKVSLLENRQVEAQSQQLALEQLYQDLSKNRDEWALAEIEQVLSTASQQLQLAGNVQGALIALQNADRSLSRSDKPQFITIRRAIAADIDKLKALPALDLTGVALRLDNVITQVDTLPMLADEKPALPAKPVKAASAALAPKAGAAATAAAAPAPVKDSMLARVQDVWQSWTGEMWDEMRQLIRVRRVDTPEALMLSPSETYFVRENVKLRLLNARMALLARNEVAFRNDLVAAQDALAKYFDTRAGTTQAAQALLRQVQASNLAIEMPSLSDSLNAVRNYKAKP